MDSHVYSLLLSVKLSAWISLVHETMAVQELSSNALISQSILKIAELFGMFGHICCKDGL
jgi:hypothetical protein